MSPVARLVIGMIRGYQLMLSPMKPAPSCRFVPSCSAYALEAVRRHGAFKGVFLGLGRIARCGPWHPGGYDPVPDRWPRCGGRDEPREEAIPGAQFESGVSTPYDPI